MKSIIKLTFWPTFLLAAVMFTGCTKGPDSYLQLQSELYTFDASGGENLLIFSTDSPWSVETEPLTTTGSAFAAQRKAWYSITPSSGPAGENLRLQVTVGENDTYSERGVFLVLRAGTREERIAVRQRQKNAILSGQNDYAVSCEEQTLTVEVQANVAYETVVESGQQWIKEAEAPTDTKALETTAHAFRIAANTEERERKGVVLFRNTETKLCDTLTIVQAAWTDPTTELTALTALYESTGGDGWTHNDNWCSDKPLNEWYGVETDLSGRVIALRLSNNNLTGELPDELSGLTVLRHLDLSHNDIGGTINKQGRPPKNGTYSFMDTMHELTTVDLSHNRIEGGLPFWSEWTSKSHKFLDYIDFSYNELDSNLREWTALFDGRNLDLRLNYNKIPTGYVPDIYLNYHSWPQMSMAIARQRADKDTGFMDGAQLPDFLFDDLTTGQTLRVQDICKDNCMTMLLSWDPLQEKSVRFAETTVQRLHKLYHGQGFDVIAVIPKGEEYRRAAEEYLRTHETEWYICSDYRTLSGEELVLPGAPYPSYMLFDAEGIIVDEIYEGKNIPPSFSMGPWQPLEDILSLGFDYYVSLCFYEHVGACKYESTDYSMDKQYELLHAATRGDGVDIVLMGDAFTDIDIEVGRYRQIMEAAKDALLSVEPLKTYKDYLNIHMVYAVSKHAQPRTKDWPADYETALDIGFITNWGLQMSHGGPTNLSDYTQDHERLQTAKVWGFVVNNCPGAGAGYINPPYQPSFGTIGYLDGTFYFTVVHEVAGHALGLLGDEYGLNQTTPTSGAIETIHYGHRVGTHLNLSLTNDPASVPWAHLIGDSRFPDVGIYRGGSNYLYGVWHASPRCIMNSSPNWPYFDTVCRELLVRRILTLAGEEYTFEKFLENDKMDY